MSWGHTCGQNRWVCYFPKFPSSKGKLTTGRDCRWGKNKKLVGPQDRRASPRPNITGSLALAWVRASPGLTPSPLYQWQRLGLQEFISWVVCARSSQALPGTHKFTQICLTPTHGGRMVPRNSPVMIIGSVSPHYKEEQKITLCDGKTESLERTGSLRLPQWCVSASEPSWNEWWVLPEIRKHALQALLWD